MIKYNSNTIYDWNFGTSNLAKVYRNNAIVFYKISGDSPTPTGSTCYEIISAPMTSYTSTTYDSVYSFADAKWYMLNNINQYEEYGIYDFVENISSATTYDGKLAIVGTTEYQYSGGSWSVVGSYVDSSVTYTIDDTNPSPYVGQELSTTFKIPYADVESIGYLDFTIRGNGGENLSISLVTYGYTEYRYMGSGSYNGTVTNDGEYFYLSLPSEAPQSIVIDEIQYWDSTPIHLIVSSKQATVEYAEKEIPIAKVYNTVADMEAVGCPTVGVGQYGVVSDNIYQFEESEEWVNKAKSSFKFVAKYNDGNANVIVCNTSNELSISETQPSYLSKAMTDAHIGNCLTSIGDNAFTNCTSLSSATIPNSVTSIGYGAFRECTSLTSVTIPDSVTSISDAVFYFCSRLTSVIIGSGVTTIGFDVFNNCTSLTSVTIPNSVTTIRNNAFANCRGLTSVTIGSGVTSIGGWVFNSCTSLTSVTVRATTPPALGTNVFSSTNCPIYVPSASVNAYKAATNWSSYASRIQAIP